MTDLTQLQKESILAPTLEGTAAATQRARSREINLRPATVVSVSPSREAITYIDDVEPGGTEMGATNVCGCYMTVGDRVMVLSNPPHGSLVVGMFRGGYVPWSFASDDIDNAPGFFGAGWVNAGGTNGLDTNAPPFAGWRRNNGVAELQGRVTRASGSATLIMWLPGGFRPRNDKEFAVVSAPIAAFGCVQVRRTGEVFAIAGSVDNGSGGFLTLNGIHYSVD